MQWNNGTRKRDPWKWILIGMGLAALVLAGCASKRLTPETAPETFPCVAEGEVQKEIPLEAELVDFSCGFKKWGGADTLHFKVAIKNISSEPQRYRVNIFLDNGKAVGGMIPRKTKKGLVKPGETASFVYPVGDTTVQPKTVLLKISTLGK